MRSTIFAVFSMIMGIIYLTTDSGLALSFQTILAILSLISFLKPSQL